MADMRADDNVIAVATIGGTGTTRVKYDGEGLRVHIYRRFAGLPWTKLNLIMETGATTAEQAARAEITGRFTTPAVGAGQVLQYGLLLQDEDGLDPNAPGFSLGRFRALVTIVAVLAGASQPGWIVDQNIGVGGTFYGRQVTTGARVTTMMMEVGENRPTPDVTGIWRIPGPSRTLFSAAATNHVLEAQGLLPGHRHFVTILLVDGAGQWSSLAEDFTTLRRKVTVSFKQLEVVNDGDPGGTSNGSLHFIVRQGGDNIQQGGANVRDFQFDHGNLSDRATERFVALEPFSFVHVIGPEVVVPGNRNVGVLVRGTEFDGAFESDENAQSDTVSFIQPAGSGREQVLNAPVVVHAKPSADGDDFEFKVTVLHSIEYVP